ncbi:MAG TPA: Wzz/FepE/Etk N-terminal domain-containing protein [Candidatus Deferrimicrobiaceae bacterium]|nr:Wzz/FepE/Etk N-terminal domain-containing protein [Candidatus Deferrimicrobiaceae bacterium]
MEENRRTGNAGDLIDLGGVLAAFERVWWKAALFSIVVGLVALAVTFQLHDRYSSAAVVTPASEEGKPSGALGALTSLGIIVGSPSKVEDLETLFRSNDLTARVFRKYDLWPIVLPDRYDSGTGKLKPTLGDRLFRGAKGPKAPGDWDAMRVAEDSLAVSVNKKAGTVYLSFEAPSAEAAAKIVGYYLEEGKSRLQEEALERAIRNKKFIQGQIVATSDPVTRERLYTLYGQEVEREMLARNREQYGFKLIDRPWVPERKASPQRAKIALLAAVLAFAVSAVILGLRAGRRSYASSAGP